MRFMERMLDNVHGYDKVKGDQKADVIRITQKLDEYQKQRTDLKPAAQLKDIVRLTFFYKDVDSLKASFAQFYENSIPNCVDQTWDRSTLYNLFKIQGKYTILEIKPKLNTPLLNVTVVVASV